MSGFDQNKIKEIRKQGLELRQRILSDSTEFLDDYLLRDYLVYTKLFTLLIYPTSNPMMFKLMMNPFDSEEYRRRSFYPYYDQVEIPVYCGAGWYTVSYTHLPGAFKNWEGLTKTKAKKMIIGPDAHGPGERWFHLERPWHQYHDEIVRWYDYWLKGIDTGIMDEPPIKLFVMGANKWRYENEWPLERTTWTKFYFRSFKRLMEDEPPLPTEVTPDVFAQQPLNTTNEIGKLEYQTQPLADDTEVTGPMAVYLYASINTENKRWVDTDWIVALKDILLDGRERELTRGYLRASHRVVDTNKSRPYAPFHPHTKESLEKIETDKVYEYAIEMRPTSNLFKSGHRIEVEITSAELPAIIHDIANHVARNDVVVHKIYRSPDHASHILLPIISETNPSQWLDKKRSKYLPGLFEGTSSTTVPPGGY